MDWAALYPAFAAAADEPDTRDEGEAAPADKPRPVTRDVEVADIGCGFGGLLFALAPRLPDTLMLGALGCAGSKHFPPSPVFAEAKRSEAVH